MPIVHSALALLAGIIGAGFASGREIARFFSGHRAASGAAITLCLLMLLFLFSRLSGKLCRADTPDVIALCRARFGDRLGRLMSALFFLLSAVTGGTMLAACSELFALTLPIHHAYALGLVASLALGLPLALMNARGLAYSGLLLVLLLPMLLLRLLALPAGEACFLPAMSADFPIRAAADGAVYASLNAAMLVCASPRLLRLPRPQQKRAIWLFLLLFGALLTLGSAVCSRHIQTVWDQPLPFVALSRQLGGGGHLLVAACMYAAALSTLCTMLCGMLSMMERLPSRSGKKVKRLIHAALCALICVFFARFGFGTLVQSAYPVLGCVCGAVLLLLCI